MQSTTMRQSVLISSGVTVVALAIYLVVAAFIPSPDRGLPLIALGVFLAVIPAVIWLIFFYQRDHVEPEPRRLVARLYLFGALVGVFAVPLSDLFIQQSITPLNSVIARLVVTVFSVSLLQEVLKLSMVRFVVLGTDEFDEHPDGIVYGLAAGLGLATVLNIDFVVSAGGVLPLQGAIIATNNAIIHGALGAFTGYYVGRIKLDGEGIEWMISGLLIATVANGLYLTISDEVTSLGLSFQPGFALIVAGVLALAMSFILFEIFQRAHKRSADNLGNITAQAQARSLDMPWDIAPRYDTVLYIALVASLIVGWGVGLAISNQTRQFDDPELPVSVTYPANWAVEDNTSGNLVLLDLQNEASFKPEFEMVANKVAAGAELEQLAQERSLILEQQFELFQTDLRDSGPVVGGQSTQRIFYTYVAQTDGGPVVVRGVDTLAFFDGRLYTLHYVVEAEDFVNSLQIYEEILSAVRFG